MKSLAKSLEKFLRNSPILKIVALVGFLYFLLGLFFIGSTFMFVGLGLLVLAGIGWLVGDFIYFLNLD